MMGDDGDDDTFEICWLVLLFLGLIYVLLT
jgi:hypothetical protein